MSEYKLLRLQEVIEQTQLSRSSIYFGIQKGSFPAPVKVALRAVRWKSEDIETWRANLSSTARGGGPAAL